MPNSTPKPARRTNAAATASASAATASQNFHNTVRPITAPIHTWFTSPARSHPNAAQAKELPLHLIQLILTYVRAVACIHMRRSMTSYSLLDTDFDRSSTMSATSRASQGPRVSSIT
jgi:hypothetical protein